MSTKIDSDLQMPKFYAIESKLNQQLLQDYKGERTAFIQVGAHKTFMLKKYETMAQDILNFKVRPNDTWLLGFPRSGTTLTQELVWLVSEDVDIERAKTLQFYRFPQIEANVLMNNEVIDELFIENSDSIELQSEVLKSKTNFIEFIDKMPSPRYIKSHLHFDLLPKDLLTCGAKVIYVARNPKDVAASYYYLNKTARYLGYTGDFQKYWDYFEKGLTLWAPYWPHVIGGWKRRNNPNLHFVFYEDISKDIKTEVLNISKFLNKKLSHGQLEKLVNHLQFENFKKNPSVNFEGQFAKKAFNCNGADFIRKGKVGAWVDDFTPEISDRADKWIADNLKNTDLRFSV